MSTASSTPMCCTSWWCSVVRCCRWPSSMLTSSGHWSQPGAVTPRGSRRSRDVIGHVTIGRAAICGFIYKPVSCLCRAITDIRSVKDSGSWSWLFAVTWRRRSRDRLAVVVSSTLTSSGHWSVRRAGALRCASRRAPGISLTSRSCWSSSCLRLSLRLHASRSSSHIVPDRRLL